MFFFSGEEKCSHFFFSPDRGYCRFRKWRKKNISLQKSVSIQSLGSSVRLSLKVREKWLQENVSCGLQLIQLAQVGLAAAQLYIRKTFFSVQRCLLEFGPGGYQPHAYFRPHACWILVPAGIHPKHVYPTLNSNFKTSSEKSEILEI